MAFGLELLYALLELSNAYLEKGIGLDDVAILGYMLAFDCDGRRASASVSCCPPRRPKLTLLEMLQDIVHGIWTLYAAIEPAAAPPRRWHDAAMLLLMLLMLMMMDGWMKVGKSQSIQVPGLSTTSARPPPPITTNTSLVPLRVLTRDAGRDIEQSSKAIQMNRRCSFSITRGRRRPLLDASTLRHDRPDLPNTALISRDGHGGGGGGGGVDHRPARCLRRDNPFALPIYALTTHDCYVEAPSLCARPVIITRMRTSRCPYRGHILSRGNLPSLLTTPLTSLVLPGNLGPTSRRPS